MIIWLSWFPLILHYLIELRQHQFLDLVDWYLCSCYSMYFFAFSDKSFGAPIALINECGLPRASNPIQMTKYFDFPS